MPFQTIKISEEDSSKRLDTFVVEKLKLSRNIVQSLITQNHIHLNDKKPKKSGVKLKSGDRVSYRIPEKVNSRHSVEEIPLNIIFEDKDILVINKHAGIVVHPDASGHETGTVVNAVLAHCKKLSGVGGEKRPGIIHRLDKDTSGALVIAKNDKTHKRIAKLFQDRKVGKTYLALVKGHMKTKMGRIEAAIKRDSKDRKRMAINPQGKMALTQFEVDTSFKDSTLLQVKIETGRTHQIRLHLASIGHPVVGDLIYGEKAVNKKFKDKYGLKRQFLHAKNLSFENHSFDAKLPEDLEKVLTSLLS